MLLLELILFPFIYLGIILLSLYLNKLFLSRTRYCVDRMGFVPFLSLWVSRERAKTRRGILHDLLTELVSVSIPIVLFLFSILIFMPFELTTWLLLMTFVVYIFTTVLGVIIDYVRIFYDPLRYNDRVFVKRQIDNNINLDYDKSTYFFDSFTTEESLSLYKEKRIGVFIFSHLVYFYNLSSTAINGWIIIKRKVVSFLGSYGPLILILTIMILISVFNPATPVDNTDVEPTTGSMFDRHGIILLVVMLFIELILVIWLPFLGWLNPELYISFELQLNKHNGWCKCNLKEDRFLRTLLVMVESYKNFEDQLKHKVVT